MCFEVVWKGFIRGYALMHAETSGVVGGGVANTMLARCSGPPPPLFKHNARTTDLEGIPML